MYIKSLNLNLSDKGTRKIFIIISSALIIAIFLIIFALNNMINSSSKLKKEYNIFSLVDYYLKAQVRVVSNKNSNDYEMEEFYLNSNEEEKYKMITTNNDGQKIEYIIGNGSLLIKNEGEKSEYMLSNYVVKKDNLLSLSTFIQICNDILLNKNLINSSCVKFETIVADNLVRYKIVFVENNLEMHECEFCDKYRNILKDGINISKMELVYDTLSNKPVQYIVYSSDNEAIIDMQILEFYINNNFDEKIFANY